MLSQLGQKVHKCRCKWHCRLLIFFFVTERRFASSLDSIFIPNLCSGEQSVYKKSSHLDLKYWQSNWCVSHERYLSYLGKLKDFHLVVYKSQFYDDSEMSTPNKSEHKLIKNHYSVERKKIIPKRGPKEKEENCRTYIQLNDQQITHFTTIPAHKL